MTQAINRLIFAVLIGWAPSFFITSVNADMVISGGSSANPATSYSAGFMNGFDFVADNDLVLTDLGFWDSGSDGLASFYEVGIWQTPTASAPSPVLLGSASIDNLDPLDTSIVVNSGSWRYETLANPVSLSQGTTYTIGWQTGAVPLSIADSLYLSPYSGGNDVSILNLERTSFAQTFNLQFPFRTIPNTFGLRGMANAKYSAAVPEPSAIFVTALFGGLLLLNRSKTHLQARSIVSL